MNRYSAVLYFAGLSALVAGFALKGPTDGEWPVYGHDNTNTKYSSLSEISPANFSKLKVAWRWRSPDDAILKERKGTQTWQNEGTPIMIGGVLYVSTSLSQVAAIDAATGKTIWTYDPQSYKSGQPPNLGFTHRGVAYWSDGPAGRIFIGTCDAYLIALDAKTGTVVTAFGQEGRIDLTKGLGRPVLRGLYGVTSPPLICRDTVIVGSSVTDFPFVPEMPPGDVRGFDARTGQIRWTFHAVAQAGESGAETWEGDSAKHTGSANVWTIMTADDETGLVYLPMSTPSNDFYGGTRHGSNLFGESLVCVDGQTGERKWHFQTTHHGLWDYDLPAAPILADISVGGRRIKAVAQLTKHGFCFVFDRVAGAPVWPIEERPVPQSTAPDEKTSPTQPFPTMPLPYDRQGVRKNDLIDFTPALRKEAETIVGKYDHGELFTPPTTKGTIYLPGWGGGANWAGGAFDPETGMLFVPSVTGPIVVTLGKAPFPHAGYVGTVTPELKLSNGLPLFKPPYGRITAIDLNSGKHEWMVPLGEGPRLDPALKSLHLPRLGWDRRGYVLATKTLLLAGQEAGGGVRRAAAERGHAMDADFNKEERKLWAFDKRTGRLIGTVELPANASGAPMTYALGGKQYVVIPTGAPNQPAELVALTVQK